MRVVAMLILGVFAGFVFSVVVGMNNNIPEEVKFVDTDVSHINFYYPLKRVVYW